MPGALGTVGAMTAEALTVDGAKNLAIGIAVVVLVAGVLITAVISAIIGRIITLVVAVVLAVVVYTQRSSIENDAKNAAKRCDVSFFGVHLTPSNAQVKQACQNATNK